MLDCAFTKSPYLNSELQMSHAPVAKDQKTFIVNGRLQFSSTVLQSDRAYSVNAALVNIHNESTYGADASVGKEHIITFVSNNQSI